MNKRLGRLGMLLSVYGSCLPTFNGGGDIELEFSFDKEEE